MTPGSKQLQALVRLLRDEERCPALKGRVYPVVVPPDEDRRPGFPVAVYARQGALQDDTLRGAAYQPAVGIAVLAPYEGDGERPGYELIEEAMGQVFQAVTGRAALGEGVALYMHPELPRDSFDDEVGLLRQEIQVVLQ